MPRPQKEPLRPLTPSEQAHLVRVSRAQSEPAVQVAHAKALLAVAAGQRFTEAARAAGRRSGDAVAQLVARFNRLGLRPCRPVMAAAGPRATAPANRSASCGRCGAPRTGRRMARPPGR